MSEEYVTIENILRPLASNRFKVITTSSVLTELFLGPLDFVWVCTHSTEIAQALMTFSSLGTR